ncbi:MAG: hypothetical protein QOJ16_985, partial [Acidobacteriota bacterium]|nr:hypothetical protein [Acidobacteriota bacterium]
PPPPVDLEENEEKQPAVPMIVDKLNIPPEQTVETGRDGINQTQVPSTLILLRDSPLAPSGFVSSVNEPNVGSQGDGIFTTHNWYAEVSTNNGGSFSFISPYSTFPSSPAAFSAGFCCDQRVAQDSSRNLIFWYLQYIKNGSTAASTNGVRLAVTHGQAGLATSSWGYYDFTPALFGLPAGTWLDFPQMQASANYLYFTTNIFTATTDSFYGALVVRIPLSQLDSGSALTFDYLAVTGSYGSILPVNGAAAEGTRPGRTTMYFAAVDTSTSIKVLTWPESTTTITTNTVTGLATTTAAVYACPGPGGLDPCTRASNRMQTGWITDTELGLMWASAQNGSSRPYPYTRVAILNPATLAVTAQPDIFSNTNAWLYPALSVNERGHVAGTLDYLGGAQLPTIAAIIRDDLSPDPVANGWEVYTVAGSNSGTAGRYGDYNGAMPHERYPKTWLAAGHTQIGGSANGNAVTHNYWFGRERDTNPSFAVTPAGTGSGTVTSSPAGINCGATCGTTAFTLGTTVTLAAAPAAGSTFSGWSGACSGIGSCVVLIDDVKSVTATFTSPQFTLTVSAAGTGSGMVTSSPAGINCGAMCSASYGSGTPVTLSAAPAAGSTFTGWSGSCTGTGSCGVTMNAARSVTATFTASSGLNFYTVAPCRILDTRSGGGGALTSGVARVIPVNGLCGVPADAIAISINAVAVSPAAAGSIVLFAGNAAQPPTSTVSYNPGTTRANNAILRLSSDGLGTLGAVASSPVDLVVDVNGYFKP